MLYKDIVSNVGKEKANEIFPEYATLQAKLDAQSQIKIASSVMYRMDESLDRDSIIKIRHGQSCNLPKAQRAYMEALWEKSQNIDEFLTEYGCIKQDDGTYIISSKTLHTDKCVCPLFHKVDEYEPISITWCECCNCHTQRGFTEICHQPIKTEILESIASGSQACVYRIFIK
jgi:hypothetical protein